ncbi:MAG: Holliday junction resolvase RuvX [Clostridiales bacterium]|nr:Holliday junction resolvase RuvX [Clostridiales bacterium]
MRLMCLDIGRKRIGVAVSDLLMITAQAVETFYRKSFDNDLEKYNSLIREYEVEKIIVGLPKNMNGTIGDMAKEVIDYTEKIKKSIDLPIEFYDERLSTKIATSALIEGNVSRKKRKKYVDMIAASVILQSYMENRKNER